MSFTPGPWFVSGVRFKMNGGEWLSVNRYDERKKRDENVACVGFDPRTGAGWDDAHLIAAARDLLAALKLVREFGCKHAPALMYLPLFKSMHAEVFAALSKAEGHIGQELAPDPERRVNGNANGGEG